MESPLLSIHGAVPAEPPDEGIAAHYGDPFREQRALERDRAFVDRSNRGVVRVAGPDRLRWLHSLLSQHLEALRPNEPTQALLLDVNGRIEHHLYLVDDGEALWAHVEPGTAPALVEFLDRMRFMLRVEVADVTDAYAVVTAAGGPPPEGALVLPDVVGTTRLIERAGLARVTGELGRPAGIWAYEAMRIAAHRPRLGLDTDARAIPHEMDLIGTAVHLEKGCYRGQETVARVHNLGRPPRRLVFLHLDGSVDRLPAHGDPIEMSGGGRSVGFVGSAARHHELGPIALALVKRTVPVEAPLLAGGVAAAQEVVVPPDTGANAKIELRGQSVHRR